MTEQDPSRLENEIELLTAIYPDQAIYSHKSRELKFTEANATLHLRIPDTYPESCLPDVLEATASSKRDMRAQTKAAIQALNLPEGEEALDAIISAFQQLVSERLETSDESTKSTNQDATTDSNTKKTVIIWLHHLLNTNKRKLCLSPPFPGVTKPGYPGVLVYSGPAAAVDAHVSELKAQNWAAFQVRYEEETEWVFGHGEGVKEVESMADMVKLVEVDVQRKDSRNGGRTTGKQNAGSAGGEAQGARQKEDFLKAVGIK
ncbi:hypothetical protein SVAN01_05594 [Stagonosporopsis vannaccii]|nr:hypothetical protein SVAN01_05594 [Stagonosporopsis vannaccii]